MTPPRSPGVPRVWRYSETPGLLALLGKALVRTMWDAGCRGCGRDVARAAVIAAQGAGGSAAGEEAGENAFLEHDITTHRRFAHVFRDLEYALQVNAPQHLDTCVVCLFRSEF